MAVSDSYNATPQPDIPTAVIDAGDEEDAEELYAGGDVTTYLQLASEYAGKTPEDVAQLSDEQQAQVQEYVEQITSSTYDNATVTAPQPDSNAYGNEGAYDISEEAAYLLTVDYDDLTDAAVREANTEDASWKNVLDADEDVEALLEDAAVSEQDRQYGGQTTNMDNAYTLGYGDDAERNGKPYPEIAVVKQSMPKNIAGFTFTHPGSKDMVFVRDRLYKVDQGDRDKGERGTETHEIAHKLNPGKDEKTIRYIDGTPDNTLTWARDLGEIEDHRYARMHEQEQQSPQVPMGGEYGNSSYDAS